MCATKGRKDNFLVKASRRIMETGFAGSPATQDRLLTFPPIASLLSANVQGIRNSILFLGRAIPAGDATCFSRVALKRPTTTADSLSRVSFAAKSLRDETLVAKMRRDVVI